jgi:hypothetical protein
LANPLASTAAAHSRARMRSHTITVYRDSVLQATLAGRIVPVGTESGAYAPVARAAEGLGGLRSSHLGLLEGVVAVINGDEVREGAQVYYVQGVTSWEGTTAVALERTR